MKQDLAETTTPLNNLLNAQTSTSQTLGPDEIEEENGDTVMPLPILETLEEDLDIIEGENSNAFKEWLDAKD